MKRTSSLPLKEIFSALLLIAGLYSGATAAAPAQVTICHIPPGNPANAHEITVGAPAVTAHMSHGDSMGACPSAGPVVFQEAEFAVCDNRSGETGRTVKINKQGRVVTTHVQCQ